MAETACARICAMSSWENTESPLGVIGGPTHVVNLPP